MLDKDLAKLYGVSVKRLNEQVKRNIARFPSDFMFRLKHDEYANLKSQFATKSWGGARSLPYAFTEHGILMLSSVLRSSKAIRTNIAIMRVFVLMRKLSFSYELLDKRLSALEKKYGKQDGKIEEIMGAVKSLIYSNQNLKRKEIEGFTA